MRIARRLLAFFLCASAGLVANEAQAGRRTDKLKDRCSDFGYREGTDAFADCVMNLSLKQQRDDPDRDRLLRRYREQSMRRRGDDRYPVCSASMMDNQLDTSINKWVGPSCQMAPD